MRGNVLLDIKAKTECTSVPLDHKYVKVSKGFSGPPWLWFQTYSAALGKKSLCKFCVIGLLAFCKSVPPTCLTSYVSKPVGGMLGGDDNDSYNGCYTYFCLDELGE